jgi:RNase H-fold protein (predicted Holliday junction resolvase)
MIPNEPQKFKGRGIAAGCNHIGVRDCDRSFATIKLLREQLSFGEVIIAHPFSYELDQKPHEKTRNFGGRIASFEHPKEVFS